MEATGRIRVLFDEQIFSAQRFGGISRYYAQLAQELDQLDGVTAKLLSPICTNYHARKVPFRTRIGFPFPAVKGTGRLIHYLNRRASGGLIRYLKPDIVHQTYYPHLERSRKPGVKTVTTVYDMIHEIFPGGFPESDQTSVFKLRSVRNADLVLCISESTRNDLVNLTDLDSEKTCVVYLGVDHIRYNPLPPPSGIRKRYLLYVGLRGAYKNFKQLLIAYGSDRELVNEFDLVCFGGGKLTEIEVGEISRLHIPRQSVRWISGGDELLSRLYQHAAAFVYPSLYEGFGIPPLEAMAHRCPVISSNSSSLPEVLGNAAEYFDANDCGALSMAIKTVTANSERAAVLTERGVQRVKQFTWKRCAEETLRAYRRII